MVQTGTSATETDAAAADTKLKHLLQRLPQMNINQKGILKVDIPHKGRSRIFVICPAALQNEVIWDTHKIVHSGMYKIAKSSDSPGTGPE